jgi:hypothetical protein
MARVTCLVADVIEHGDIDVRLSHLAQRRSGAASQRRSGAAAVGCRRAAATGAALNCCVHINCMSRFLSGVFAHFTLQAVASLAPPQQPLPWL